MDRTLEVASATSGLAVTSCRLCGVAGPLIAASLGVCGRCLARQPGRALPHARVTHREVRRRFALPEVPPRAARGVACAVCLHECVLPPGKRGYCNLRENVRGHMRPLDGDEDAGVLRWSREPLPAGCIAMDVCGECDTCERDGVRVFYGACALNCLGCQSWRHLEDAAQRAPRVSVEELARTVTGDTACVSFHGGDPAPQIPHALIAAHLARQAQSVRICWETNAFVHPSYLRLMVNASLDSGGTIKVDLKAWSEPLHQALTGFTNRRILENFATVARQASARRRPPLVVASTLLVPGYVDENEVRPIASFIASIDRAIPYRLLPFVPAFMLTDLPPTPRDHAERALAAARAAGLTDVALVHEHLLGDAS